MKIYDIELKFNLVQEDVCVTPLLAAHQTVEYMKGAFDSHPEQESFWVIPLDRRGNPKGRHMITLGLLAGTLAHPREVFRTAILASAASIVCVHNHPSGDPSPSTADTAITRQLRESGKLLGIGLTDHVIIGSKDADPLHRGYYSYNESGIL